MLYLDYAATNPWPEYLCSNYNNELLNANANYATREHKMLCNCCDEMKKLIGMINGKVVFGGTSSQLIENLMNSIYDKTEPFLIIGSSYEHESFDRFIDYKVKNINELEVELQKHPDRKKIVLWMGVNNIAGTVFDVVEIGNLCHKYNAFYVCDATAMLGHEEIPTGIDNWCDCIVSSTHKISTELGLGFMWISDNLNNFLYDFKLYGTPNLAGALSIVDATKHAIKNVKVNKTYWKKLQYKLEKELNNNNIAHEFIDFGTPAISAIRIYHVNARALQSYLASKNIYVGIGQSSCAENTDTRVLRDGYELWEEEASEVIRVSFGEYTAIENIIELVAQIKLFKNTFV